jgi:hypothetical protein
MALRHSHHNTYRIAMDGSIKSMKYQSAWRRGINHRFIAVIGLNIAYQRNRRLLGIDITLYKY